MTPESALALFGVMLVLALVPGISVLTVTARTASGGLNHGIVTTLGIMTGDIIYILIALLGLALLFDSLTGLGLLVKYIGGAWLVWLGVAMLRRPVGQTVSSTATGGTLWSSYLAGLLVTLADQKAIIFYLVFLPAFVNLSILTYRDIPLVILLAVSAVGIAKLVYVYVACKARLLSASKPARVLNLTAGAVLIVIGLTIMLRP